MDEYWKQMTLEKQSTPLLGNSQWHIQPLRRPAISNPVQLCLTQCSFKLP